MALEVGLVNGTVVPVSTTNSEYYVVDERGNLLLSDGEHDCRDTVLGTSSFTLVRAFFRSGEWMYFKEVEGGETED